MAAPSTVTRLTVPLFSSDYAHVNREIAEWNRRARAASLTLDEKIENLQNQINSLSSDVNGVLTVGRATPTVYGTVVTDVVSPTPRVYLTTTVDGFIAFLQAQLDALSITVNNLDTTVNTLVANQVPLRGNGPPDGSVIARYDGDEYWDMDAGPDVYRWDESTSDWLSF